MRPRLRSRSRGSGLWGTELGLPVVPIPGTRRPTSVDENIGSLSLALDDEAMSVLGALADRVVGPRSDQSDPN